MNSASNESTGRRRRPASAVTWQRANAGSAVDSPLAEWAYVTPRFPEGITGTDLRRASPEIQRETAVFWFSANHAPYDEGVAPKWGEGRWGESRWSNLPYGPSDGTDLLQREFEGVLKPAVIDVVGTALGENWMWLPPKLQTEIAYDQSASDDSLHRELLKSLDEFSDQLAMIETSRGHGSPGHNLPPEGSPLSAEEKEEALSAVQRVRTAVASGTRVSLAWFQQVWKPAQTAVLKIGARLAIHLDDLVSGLSRHGGVATGKNLDKLLVVGAAALTTNQIVRDLAYAYLTARTVSDFRGGSPPKI